MNFTVVNKTNWSTADIVKMIQAACDFLRLHDRRMFVVSRVQVNKLLRARVGPEVWYNCETLFIRMPVCKMTDIERLTGAASTREYRAHLMNSIIYHLQRRVYDDVDKINLEVTGADHILDNLSLSYATKREKIEQHIANIKCDIRRTGDEIAAFQADQKRVLARIAELDTAIVRCRRNLDRLNEKVAVADAKLCKEAEVAD
jgi:uncharacterized protein YukE